MDDILIPDPTCRKLRPVLQVQNQRLASRGQDIQGTSEQVIPAQAEIQPLFDMAPAGRFAALTLRAARWAFNALRAFVPPARE